MLNLQERIKTSDLAPFQSFGGLTATHFGFANSNLAVCNVVSDVFVHKLLWEFG